MIVDSSALPEQVTRDVVASAFQSAGQRCSALRVLFVQDDVADAMLTMIAGAMEALSIGDPRDLDTDVGPVIDEEAKAALDAHVARLEQEREAVARLELPRQPARAASSPRRCIEIDSLSELESARISARSSTSCASQRGELGKVIDADQRHRLRPDAGPAQPDRHDPRAMSSSDARVGNLYVNRNQIGAVVESQPFGGEGLSGTGPKAGGPHYVARFATERVTCIDTTAAAAMPADGGDG